MVDLKMVWISIIGDPFKSSQVNTILLQTPIAYTKDILTKKVMEFVKGKPKGTNPAIMGLF